MKRQLSWTGYKVHVPETCDDGAAHLITHVKTCPAMQPDMTSTAEIHERLGAKGLLPVEHFVDSGYVDAKLLASSQREHGLSLEGPVRGIASRVGQGYELRHFAIDRDREQVTCRQGKASVSWRTIHLAEGSPRIQALFSRSDCRMCSGRGACTPATSARRIVHIHLREEYDALNAARARMTDPVWVECYHKRAGVAGTLSQGVRAFGMRRSRYIGLAKTGLNRSGFAGGCLVWVRRPRRVPRLGRSSAPRPRRAECCRWARAGAGC
jgi:transposase